MKEQKKYPQLIFINSNSGITLIELLVSIVLISIIIVTFMTIFIQSAKTNKLSDEIIDATYLAQTYMETVYNLSENNTYDKVKDLLLNEEKFQIKSTDLFYKKSDDFIITLKITIPENGISSVLVKIYGNSSMNELKAQMETRLTWKKD